MPFRSANRQAQPNNAFVLPQDAAANSTVNQPQNRLHHRIQISLEVSPEQNIDKWDRVCVKDRNWELHFQDIHYGPHEYELCPATDPCYDLIPKKAIQFPSATFSDAFSDVESYSSFFKPCKSFSAPANPGQSLARDFTLPRSDHRMTASFAVAPLNPGPEPIQDLALPVVKFLSPPKESNRFRIRVAVSSLQYWGQEDVVATSGWILEEKEQENVQTNPMVWLEEAGPHWCHSMGNLHVVKCFNESKSKRYHVAKFTRNWVRKDVKDEKTYPEMTGSIEQALSVMSGTFLHLPRQIMLNDIRNQKRVGFRDKNVSKLLFEVDRRRVLLKLLKEETGKVNELRSLSRPLSAFLKKGSFLGVSSAPPSGDDDIGLSVVAPSFACIQGHYMDEDKTSPLFMMHSSYLRDRRLASRFARFPSQRCRIRLYLPPKRWWLSMRPEPANGNISPVAAESWLMYSSRPTCRKARWLRHIGKMRQEHRG
ncbi:hypothetical protein C8J56DRAFT_900662 [Mycena floridula]|nr:hypothetical protein C8J56DRAFT_900662 [Mycena floridula]